MTGGPAILVALPRELVERLAPGAIREAELHAQGFADKLEREAWIAGNVGAHLEAALR